MGEYLGFRCNFCGYEESQLPVGKGKDPATELKLFVCSCCKSVHSTWVKGDEQPRCSLCYDRDIRILEPQSQTLACPKCNADAVIVTVPGSWD